MPELKANLHDASHAEATTQALSAKFATRPAPEWVEALAPLGAAVTIFNHTRQLIADPQVQARGSVVDCAGVPVPASPVRVMFPDGDQTATATAAPHQVGEDTSDVLASAGFSEPELAVLAAAGLI
jgi:crotonobetainyl-CoA:carnitine CoA-transferase CaiB-like acyl-CoA transferase